MKFIKLTAGPGDIKYINAQHISVFCRAEGYSYTSVFLIGEEETELRFDETPEEIIALLKGTYTKDFPE